MFNHSVLLFPIVKATSGEANEYGSGEFSSGDDSSSSSNGLSDGEIAAIVVSAITGAILLVLLIYFLVVMYCPVSTPSKQSFSPVLTLSVQPIVQSRS